jgi:hypothetical protein
LENAPIYGIKEPRLAEDRRRNAARQREVLRAGELSDADLEAIARTEMAARHRHLDDELK